jgi:hypothetical protein
MINRPWRKSEPQAIVLPERTGVLQSPGPMIVRRPAMTEALTLPGARSCRCGAVAADPYDRFCGQCGVRLF